MINKFVNVLIIGSLLLFSSTKALAQYGGNFEDPDRGYPNEPLNAPPEEEIRNLQRACDYSHNQLISTGQGYSLFSILSSVSAVCFYVYNDRPYVYAEFNTGAYFTFPKTISPQACANQLRVTGARTCY